MASPTAITSSEKITIIVPCYNVENYIERCLKSILSQTYGDIEVVLVDDRSTDGTKKIIQSYEKKFKNIRAIYNKQNRRQGYARNVALESTRSKYVMFVDSDDWLEPNFIKELYTALIHSGADVVVSDIYMRHDNPAADYRVVMYDPKPTRYGLMNVGLAASSSNKLFKTEVIRNFKYPEDIINEDISVVLAIMYKYRVVYTDKTYYNYYQRPGSTQNGEITSKRFDVFEAVAIFRNNLGGRIDKKTWDSVVWHQIIQLLLGVLPRASGTRYRRQLIKEFCDLTKEHNIDIFNNQHMRKFIAETRSHGIYMGGLMSLLKHRLFFMSSVLMGCFIFYLRRKHKLEPFKKLARLPALLVKDPKTFFGKLKARIFRRYVIKKNLTINDLTTAAKKQRGLSSGHLVSVIIPNYNYERFLVQRIYSILYQTEKIGEIIILDDNSTDHSVELAREIKEAIGEYVPIRLINNTKNQGTFRQWERGFAESKYEYVWIAEADDFCDSKFLESTLRPLKDSKTVVISYADTGFIYEDGLFLESVKRHIDYQESGHWDRSYVNNGVDEVREYSYLNNTIANVSSVIFRKREDIHYPELFSYSRDYKQAGDWVFYVNYMLHGDIAYIDKPLNYYRLHGNNVSSKTKASDHLNEIYRVYDMLDKRLHLTKAHKRLQRKRIKFLKKAWNI